MRRRLLLFVVLYQAAGIGCPRCKPVDEYCDIIQDRCSPCNRLCFPGQGTNASCHRLCPEYAQMTATSSKLMIQPEPSSPPSQTQPYLQTPMWVMLAFLVVIAVVLTAALIFRGARWLHSRRDTKTQVADSSYRPCPLESGQVGDETNGDQEEGRAGRNVICPGGPGSTPRAVPSSWDSRTNTRKDNIEWEIDLTSSPSTPFQPQAGNTV